MSRKLNDRRRILDGGTSFVSVPPKPVMHIYPSYGNTLTYTTQGQTSTVTNSQYQSWDSPGLSTTDLVDTNGISSVTSTALSQPNMVFLYVYCPGTPGATITVNISYCEENSHIRPTVDTITGTTTTSSFVSLSVDNNISFLTSSTLPSPNKGNPYLDFTDLAFISVSATATKGGQTSEPAQFNIYLQGSTPQITVEQPVFSPAGGTYNSSQTVTVTTDSNVQGLVTYYTLSSQAENPYPGGTAVSSTSFQVPVSQTCYLNARSALRVDDTTTILSNTTSEHYTITGGGATQLYPPSFDPSPGTFYESPITVTFVNPNYNPNDAQVIYYTTDGTDPTPLSNSVAPGSTIPIYVTTTVKAMVGDPVQGIYSGVASGTYDINTQYITNEAFVTVNTDLGTTCGSYQLKKVGQTGYPDTNYGFVVDTLIAGSTVYFTIDGTEPTTSSQSIVNGQWYYLEHPNTVLVKYLVVAENCADIVGQFWIRINKAVSQYLYSGLPFVLGTGSVNWYSEASGNYDKDTSCYVYLGGERLEIGTGNTSIVTRTVQIWDGTQYQDNYVNLVVYTPPQNTPIDSQFVFYFGYSAPEKNWEGKCPYSPFNMTNAVYANDWEEMYDAMIDLVFNQNPSTGVYSAAYGYPDTIFFSSNEIDTMCCAGMVRMTNVLFEGSKTLNISPCSEKTSLDYGCIELTNVETMDLRPCSSMTRLDDMCMSGTVSNASVYTRRTSISHVYTPYTVSSIGNNIFARYYEQTNPSIGGRNPIDIVFYNPIVPTATRTTFNDIYGYSGTILPSSGLSTGEENIIIVDGSYTGADVCDYDDTWHGTAQRGYSDRSQQSSSSGYGITQMRIVDQNGLICNDPTAGLATVTTGTVYSTLSDRVTLNSNQITSDGGTDIKRYGVCVSTSQNPTYYSGIVTSFSNTPSTLPFTYNCTVQGLSGGTVYYARAFAVNQTGVSYGSNVMFTTQSAPQPQMTPTVVKGPYSANASQYQNTYLDTANQKFLTGWEITDPGSSSVTWYGAYYRQGQIPTTLDNSITGIQITMTGTHYYVSLDYSSLTPGATYYIRGCAQNSVGYGLSADIIQFVVPNNAGVVLPSIEVGEITCTYGGSYSGYLAAQVELKVTEVGTYGQLTVQYAYGTGTNPTNWTDATSSNVNSVGSIFVLTNELTANTTYYVRARVKSNAPNGGGWVGSTQKTFVATSSSTVTTGTPQSTEDNQIIVTGTASQIAADLYYGFLIKQYAGPSTPMPSFSSCQGGEVIMVGRNGSSSQSNFSFSNSSNAFSYPNGSILYIRAFTSNSMNNPTTVNYGNIESVTVHYYDSKKVSVSSSEYRYPATVNVSFCLGRNTVSYGPVWVYGWGVDPDRFHGGVLLTHCWDYIGNGRDSYESNTSNDPQKARDLFGWGCTSMPHRPSYYEPNSMGGDNSNYFAYNVATANINDPSYTGQANWAYQVLRDSASLHWYMFNDLQLVESSTGVITKEQQQSGSLSQNYSRPLTSSEMSYVLFNRSTPSGKRFCKACIDHGTNSSNWPNGTRYTNGLLILSDTWTTSTYTLYQYNTLTAQFNSNVITESAWNQNFKNSCTFLPAAGYRMGDNSLSGVNQAGYYWLCDSDGANYAKALYFDDGTVGIISVQKKLGCSVRLFTNQ